MHNGKAMKLPTKTFRAITYFVQYKIPIWPDLLHLFFGFSKKKKNKKQLLADDYIIILFF